MSQTTPLIINSIGEALAYIYNKEDGVDSDFTDEELQALLPHTNSLENSDAMDEAEELMEDYHEACLVAGIRFWERPPHPYPYPYQPAVAEMDAKLALMKAEIEELKKAREITIAKNPYKLTNGLPNLVATARTPKAFHSIH